MYKKDCFAFMKEGRCFALTTMECSGCKFYKKCSDPTKEQRRLMKESQAYTGRKLS